MKASAVVLACIAAAAATPSWAFGHFGGPHLGGFHFHGPGSMRHDHRRLGYLNGGFDSAVLPGLGAPDSAAPIGYQGPATYFFAAAPAHINPGPQIIYIGHKPANNGPKVIYGTH